MNTDYKIRPNFADIASSLSVLRKAEKNRDLIDPLRFSDVTGSNPTINAKLLIGATRAACFARDALTVAWPKGSSTKPGRELTASTPFLEVNLHYLTRPVAEKAAKQLSASVAAPRVRTTGAGWATNSVLDGWYKREKELRSAFSHDPNLLFVSTDIARHFDTLTEWNLVPILNSLSLDTFVVDRVIDSFKLRGNGSGLPTGPYASGLLGSVALIPIDRVLARYGVQFFRLSDDYIALVSNESEAEFIISELSMVLAARRQCLNLDKTKILDDPGSLLRSSELDSPYGSPTNRSIKPGSVDPSELCLAQQITNEDAAGIRRTLGKTAGLHSWQVLELLTANSTVWQMEPTATRRALNKRELELSIEDCERIGDFLPTVRVGTFAVAATTSVLTAISHTVKTDLLVKHYFHAGVDDDALRHTTAGIAARGLLALQSPTERVVDSLVDVALHTRTPQDARIALHSFHTSGSERRYDRYRNEISGFLLTDIP